jgi:hypothetical protein
MIADRRQGCFVPVFPDSTDPRIGEFLRAAQSLLPCQWLRIVELAVGEETQVASSEAYQLVTGARLVKPKTESRLAAMHAAHDRVNLPDLNDTVTHGDLEIALRAEAETACRHVINALLTGGDLSEAAFRMIVLPFEDFLWIDHRARTLGTIETSQQ